MAPLDRLKILFQTQRELSNMNMRVPKALRNAFLLLHSYLLVKPTARPRRLFDMGPKHPPPPEANQPAMKSPLVLVWHLMPSVMAGGVTRG